MKGFFKKMIYYSHRGNIDGPISKFENHPDYIKAAIFRGFDVEVDIWKNDKELFLGHDFPKYKVLLSFLVQYGKRLLFHAKNFEALRFLSSNAFHVFWQDNDDYSITSSGLILAHSKTIKSKPSAIWMMPENTQSFLLSENCLGVCSDSVLNYYSMYGK